MDLTHTIAMDVKSTLYGDNPATKGRLLGQLSYEEEKKDNAAITRKETVKTLPRDHSDISFSVDRPIKTSHRCLEKWTPYLMQEVNRGDGALTTRNELTLLYLERDWHIHYIQRQLGENEDKAWDLQKTNDQWKQAFDKMYSYDSDKNYDLLNKLGSGTFGEVWKANTENDDCAIKKMEIASKGEHILNEISHMKQSNHVNIPKYIDSFMVSQEELWLVMEYIHGVDVFYLSYYIEMNAEQIATICYGVLSALAYLHNKKIIHRDVKGENIMVNNNGHVYLTDFGTSILEGPYANTASGTIGFKAPEVLATETYKCNVDVFSLGMTIVQMVTGKYPYANVPAEDIRDLILNNQRPPIQNQETMPPNMMDFLNLCLEWDPACRPSASKLLEHDYMERKATPEALGILVEGCPGRE